jgi:Fanconi anemia group M protein
MRFASHPLLYSDTVEDREYQRRIAEAATDRNTLIVLPTALGKTVISALIAANVLYGYRDKRVLVMAPTRPLVMQHKGTFQRIMRLPDRDFTVLTGKTPSDLREVVWNGPSRIVFATPQVVKNDILREGLSLRDFGLLVFDECHRAVKEYAYTEVAQQYVKHSDYPLILGMTASPGSDAERVRAVCESLFVEHVEYRMDEDPDVKPYIHPIEVEWRRVDLPLQYHPLRDLLGAMLDDRLRWLSGKGHLRGALGRVTRSKLIELGAELRYNAELSMEEERGPIYRAIMEQSMALTLFHMLELVETQGVYTLKAFMDRMENDGKRGHRTLAGEQLYGRLLQLLDDEASFEHPKVDLLRQVVSDQLRANPGSRLLVFTQYRDTATHLIEELTRIDGVRAERFVGQASRLGDVGLTQEEQAALVEDLRNGHLNILVATSIAEEGLDIPEVDLVVFYEPIPSEIRYIQRRGRTGRRTAGKTIILATNDTSDMISLYASSRRVEKMSSIASKLNSMLKPVLRLRPRPATNPMPKEEIAEIHSITGPKAEPITNINEMQRLKHTSRQVAKAQRTAYLKILEKGTMGLSDEELTREMEEEGYSKGVARAAVSRLVKEKRVKASDGRSAIPLKNIPTTISRNIEIEKVMQGHAVAWVDEKWRARLTAEDYDGPQDLIRKGSKFKALCHLYHEGETLCVRVRQVVQAQRSKGGSDRT